MPNDPTVWKHTVPPDQLPKLPEPAELKVLNKISAQLDAILAALAESASAADQRDTDLHSVLTVIKDELVEIRVNSE